MDNNKSSLIQKRNHRFYDVCINRFNCFTFNFLWLYSETTHSLKTVDHKTTLNYFIITHLTSLLFHCAYGHLCIMWVVYYRQPFDKRVHFCHVNNIYAYIAYNLRIIHGRCKMSFLNYDRPPS